MSFNITLPLPFAIILLIYFAILTCDAFSLATVRLITVTQMVRQLFAKKAPAPEKPSAN